MTLTADFRLRSGSSTLLGAGPFPTEQDNDTGQYIRDKGHEYGTTTGRPRRCGWFDAVAVSYSVQIGAVDSIALLHLDTLSGLRELKICTSYQVDGRPLDFFPANITRLAKAEPVYETVGGWDEEITEVTSFKQLPDNAKNYVACVEAATARPVSIVGVGPKRSQTLFRE